MSEKYEKTNAQDAQVVSSVIYTGIGLDGNFKVGTELPAGGFATSVKECLDFAGAEHQLQIGGLATGGGAVVEDMTKCLDSVVEPKYDLSMLPQNKRECYSHLMWDLSKKCVVCYNSEYGGAVTSNIPLFNEFNCNFVRACNKHHDAVSVHFAKPEFNEPIDNPSGFYQIRRCLQCSNNFSAISDSSSSFCDKGCQGNWLNKLK